MKLMKRICQKPDWEYSCKLEYKNIFHKYLLEFIVNVTSISISFYDEKQNAIPNKVKEDSLKN